MSDQPQHRDPDENGRTDDARRFEEGTGAAAASTPWQAPTTGPDPAPGHFNPWDRSAGTAGPGTSDRQHSWEAPGPQVPSGAPPMSGPGWNGPGRPGPSHQGHQAYGYQPPPKPGVVPLRPLGLGEILDGAFQACRRNPLATFGIAILLQVLVALVPLLMLGTLSSSFDVLLMDDPTEENLIGAFAGVGTFASVSSLVSGVALLILQAVLVIPVARSVIGQRTSFGQAWRLARGRLLPLLGFGALAFAAGLLGLGAVVGIAVLAALGLQLASAFLIVPLVLGAGAVLIWIGIKLVVAPAALMLERTGPWASIKRSWLLTRGNWWRTFGIMLLTTLIVSVITSVITAPLTFAIALFSGFGSSPAGTEADLLGSLPLLLATQGITALFAAVGYAFQAGVAALLYVDLRIRREGYDVVLMREHERAGAGTPDVVPGGTASFGHRPGDPL